ncbi:tRNA pseudouridine synthase 1 [Lambiella insularis]|nr:tRNA pseudouridine synthase 1 [Lambiella insularis]
MEEAEITNNSSQSHNMGSAGTHPAETMGSSLEAKPTHDHGRGRGNKRSRGTRDRDDRNKRSDMGRGEWSRKSGDRRERNEESAKRRRLNPEESIRKPIYAVNFSKEEIESEERKPKRKVAVMIGYSGSGYKGMQLNDKEKTIEGDLFKAFVAAGAVSKANANDPKKSSLVRCARTDKGVHAAGNVISMKLIIEDPEIIKKINENLSPQIRVWGIERTNGSFSAYQLCDSRIYEYLIPTHCFLPPHPDSYLGRKLLELADEVGDGEGYRKRQEEVATFWTETEERYIKPILDDLDPEIRPLIMQALYHNDSNSERRASDAGIGKEEDKHEFDSMEQKKPKEEFLEKANSDLQLTHSVEDSNSIQRQSSHTDHQVPLPTEAAHLSETKQVSPTDAAIRTLRAAYITAKKAYRISPERISRVRSALSRYNGTHNYHNYTVNKAWRDPSAKRVIKTFTVSDTLVVIGNTEWLSLKVHGQSFMMHQIRKMVSMAALVVRCGCHEGRIQDSYESDKLIIPKAPGLGLLLERPVFDSYNERPKNQEDRGEVAFEKYKTEMGEFKQREIYERIYREEERDNLFHAMFSSIDNLRGRKLLYLSSKGTEATKDGGEVGLGDDTLLKEVVDAASSDDEAEAEDG